MSNGRDYSLTQNRELSWLKFNERVLEEAMFEEVPLYEKLKFVSIFTSNLDEFYMIRVGSLRDLVFMKSKHFDTKTGMTDLQQLDAIYKETKRLYSKRDVVYQAVMMALEKHGIRINDYESLSKEEKKIASKYFQTNILPILSAQIVDVHHPFPHLVNKRHYIVVTLRHKNHQMLGIVPCPEIRNIVSIEKNVSIPMEQLIYAKVDEIFQTYEIKEKAIIRVTRNADIDVSDDILDEMDDYRIHMKKVLKKRARLAPVRLEAYQFLPLEIKKELLAHLKLTEKQVFISHCPLDMGFVFAVAKKVEKALPYLFYSPYSPALIKEYDSEENMIDQIAYRDMLLHYPYESMTPFLKLLKDSAEDKRVISIKITLYRLSNPSKIVENLILAAENGKDVTVLIELKARFDEQNNIDWAEILEEAGCNVFYGFDDYKVHSKICLITYQNASKISHIVQVGTGNYNEKTAKMYTDLCLMSANSQLTQDTVAFFSNMTQGNLDGEYHHLLVAPCHLKQPILSMIDEQIAIAKKNGEGYIFMKINSLSDLEIIDKLIEASQAQVKVELVVRGITCLIPQIPNKTDNITIRSIVGRYLEHSRIYIFGKGEDAKMYLSSADMMTRNTNNRVEVACPILDKRVREKVWGIVDVLLSDQIKARMLGNDKEYHIIDQHSAPISAQNVFMENAKLAESQRSVKKKNKFKETMRKLFHKRIAA